jgi:hypothetical protein
MYQDVLSKRCSLDLEEEECTCLIPERSSLPLQHADHEVPARRMQKLRLAISRVRSSRVQTTAVHFFVSLAGGKYDYSLLSVFFI